MTRISALLRAERVSAGRFAAIPLIVTALPSTASTMVAAATPPSTTDRRARHASSSSPICRSPLSQQHSFRTDTPAPIHITNGSSTTPSHSPGITLSPRRLSTSRSLAGSYTLSLLSSRMSAAHPTHHVPSAFTLKIGSVSTGRQVKSALRCPEHVKIAFDARWYELEGAGAAAWTPWVGNVDVEGWYRHQRRLKTLEWARAQRAAVSESALYDEEEEGKPSAMLDLDTYYERILKGWIPTNDDILHAPPSDRPLLRRMRCPPRPGYEVGVSGKMQFFVMQTLDQLFTTASPCASAKMTSTPVKVFLVDYDLASLEPGGRLLYKERAYQTVHDDPHRTQAGSSPVATTASPGAKPRAREVLKYAFELHFLCLETPQKSSHPAATTESAKRKRTSSTAPGKSYYLGKQIRLVFPTSSSSLNTTDGAPATTTAHVPPAPSIRVERLIEVQNPIPTADEHPFVRDSAASLKSGSFTSESWQGLREAGGQEAASSMRLKSGGPLKLKDSARSVTEARMTAKSSPTLPPPIVEEMSVPSGLIFTRSPTPIQPMTLKSPSLLTARLEEMSSLSPQITANTAVNPLNADSLAQGDEPSRMASPSGSRKRTLWPPDDTERLLSESLQKLSVSYR